MSLGTLFHHVGSKLDLLASLMNGVMDDLLAETEAAREMAPSDPESQLTALVGAHVLFHVQRSKESFIGNSELRSLGPHREAIVAKRDLHQRRFDTTIRAGIAAGVFSSENPAVASRSIVTMCTAVATWYDPEGPLAPAQIARLHSEYALALLRSPRWS